MITTYRITYKPHKTTQKAYSFYAICVLKQILNNSEFILQSNTKNYKKILLHQYKGALKSRLLSVENNGLFLTRRCNDIVGYMHSRNKVAFFILDIHLPLVQSLAFKLQLSVSRHRLSLNNRAHMVAADVDTHTNFLRA